MTTQAYCAAAELCSPNSPEFECVLEQQDALHMALLIARLRSSAAEAARAGEINDEQHEAVALALTALLE